MKFNWLKTVVAGTALLVSSCMNIANAGLIVDNGELLGATEIDINGTLYDVSFVEGSCSDLFNGCDEVSDFFWQTAADALAASEALLDDVLLDSTSGNFDTDPESIFGCDNLTNCQISTVWGISVPGYVQVSWVDNYNVVSGDRARVSSSWRGWAANDDFGLNGVRTYALWSETVLPAPSILPINNPQNPAQVSEPATLALFGLAVFGLVTRRRA